MVDQNKVVILWTSRDKEVASMMAFMYAHYSLVKEWWKEVELIIWGPATELTSHDADIQAELKQLQEDGVKLSACVTCANRYGVADQLRELGVTVIPMGPVLTDYIKAGIQVISV